MFFRWFSGALLALTLAAFAPSASASGSVTVAAASDLTFAKDDLVTTYQRAHPADAIHVIYGSSGKFSTQIQPGAPFDLFLSADIS